MATYLQGVTDYIPDYQPFQPDLNFYANLLQAKQNQYDTNYKAINNVYGSLYNAELTNPLNIKKKDELLKQIDFNLKRVSGLDLSLQQNVDQATQVFRPFYEDKYLMRDMAYTKNFNNTYSAALALNNSSDAKQKAKYWIPGIKELQYKREEFRDASLEETLNISSPMYTNNEKPIQKYLEMAKDLGIKADVTQPDPTGMYFIRQKNGDLILPTLQKLFMSSYATDPALQQYYNTIAYVDRKDNIAQSAEQNFNGDKLAAEKDYLQKKYNWLQNYSAELNEKNEQDLNVTKNKISTTEQQVKDGNVNFKQSSYFEQLNQALKIDETVAGYSKNLNEKINENTTSSVSTSSGTTPGLDLNNMALARLKVDAGVASVNAQNDILAASDAYAYTDYLYDIDVNPVGLEKMRHSNAVSRLGITHQNKMQQIKYQNDLKTQSDAIESLVDSGQYYYESFVDPNGKVVVGPLKLNEQWNQQQTSPGGSGQAGPEIKVDENNKELTRAAEDKLTGGYIDKWFTNMRSLISTGRVSEDEVWAIMNGGTKTGRQTVKGMTAYQRIPISSETVKELGLGTREQVKAQNGVRRYVEKRGNQFFVTTEKSRENGIQEFNKYYYQWKKDKANGKKIIQAKLPNVMEGMDEWVKRNAADDNSLNYYDENYKNAKTWSGLMETYEQVEIENDNKIRTTLGKSIKDIKNKDKIVDLYMNALRAGGKDAEYYLGSIEGFQRMLEANNINIYADQRGQTRPLTGGGIGWLAKGLNSLTSDERAELDKQLRRAAKSDPARSGQQKDSEYNITPRKRGEIERQYVSRLFGLDPSTGQRNPKKDIEQIYSSLSQSYTALATDPNPNSGLVSLVPVTATTSGKVALASDKSYYNVNPAIPQSVGSKAFLQTYGDIMRINWNQDSDKYKISIDGSTKSAEILPAGPDYAKALLNAMYTNFKPGSKGSPFRIEQSQIAMENKQLGAMTIYPSMAFLKANITSVFDGESYSTDKDDIQAQIDKMYKNGITFIAPKNEWNNMMFTGNQPTPVEQLVNAKGTIKYNDINNAGSYEIERVDIPEADYRISFKARSLQPDGSVKEYAQIPQLLPKGNKIDQAYTEMFNTITQINQNNLELYRQFHKDNNGEAIKRAEQNFGFTKANSGFNF
jgi:hypothetical protein